MNITAEVRGQCLVLAPHGRLDAFGAKALGQEIHFVVDYGDFVDMRRLLDSSALKRALTGVSYIEILRRDPRGAALRKETE